MNAVIYARYSSHSQREESIEGQLRECNEYAARNGMTVVGEYIDRAISGKTDERAAFQQMIRDSEKQNWEAVIVYTIDRIARNRYDSAVYKAKLKKNGVHLYYATQVIPEGPEGIILESLLEGLSEYYSENLARNIKRGIMENALACKFVGGNIPLGFKINENLGYEIDPVGANIVREIFQHYADGMTAKQVIDYCNERGYRTGIGRPFTRNSLSVILRNDKYLGVYRCGEVVIEDGIPAIIDKELWGRVQAMLKHNANTKARGKSPMDFMLTTKLFCGHCGSTMVGESGTGRNGASYYYYKCLNRKRGHSCDKKPENKEWLEKFVVSYTVQQMLTDENIEMIATRAMEIIEKDAADKSVLEGLKVELKDAEKRINNILDLMEQGIATDSTKSRLLDLEAKKSDLISQIAREETKRPFLTKERIMFWLESFKNGDVENVEFQRRVIDTLVNSVYVYDTNGGKGRKFIFTWNLSANSTSTINVSDIEGIAPPQYAHPNQWFFLGETAFGCVYEIEDIG